MPLKAVRAEAEVELERGRQAQTVGSLPRAIRRDSDRAVSRRAGETLQIVCAIAAADRTTPSAFARRPARPAQVALAESALFNPPGAPSPNTRAPQALARARASWHALTTNVRSSPVNCAAWPSVRSRSRSTNAERSAGSSAGAKRVLPSRRDLTGTTSHRLMLRGLPTDRAASVQLKSMTLLAKAARSRGSCMIVLVTSGRMPSSAMDALSAESA